MKKPSSPVQASPKPKKNKKTEAVVASTNSLEVYQKRRDFLLSPEPSGKNKIKKKGALTFCVQKHLASHLHYDFRLEHRSVLLSWAVPKGPSLDPSVKRLAMQVEDHPIEYGSFEGVIPSGYGAGIVLLWDTGIWQPIGDDIDEALERGNLPFLLLGTKLKGAWSLIRTRSAGGKAWLLKKQHDPWASKNDITLTQSLSVKSAGDFADVLAQTTSDPWPGKPPVAGGNTGELFRKIIETARQRR